MDKFDLSSISGTSPWIWGRNSVDLNAGIRYYPTVTHSILLPIRLARRTSCNGRAVFSTDFTLPLLRVALSVKYGASAKVLKTTLTPTSSRMSVLHLV